MFCCFISGREERDLQGEPEPAGEPGAGDVLQRHDGGAAGVLPLRLLRRRPGQDCRAAAADQTLHGGELCRWRPERRLSAVVST